MTPNGIEIFNPLDHGIHGQPLMVPAHEYNALLGLLRECEVKFEAYQREGFKAAPIYLIRRIGEALAPRQASNPSDQRAGASPAPTESPLLDSEPSTGETKP